MTDKDFQELDIALKQMKFSEAQHEATVNMMKAFPKMAYLNFATRDKKGFAFGDKSHPLSTLAAQNSLAGSLDKARLAVLTRVVMEYIISSVAHLKLHADEIEEEDIDVLNDRFDFFIEMMDQHLEDGNFLSSIISLLSTKEIDTPIGGKVRDLCKERGIRNIYHPCEKVNHPLNHMIEDTKEQAKREQELRDKKIQDLFKNAGQA